MFLFCVAPSAADDDSAHRYFVPLPRQERGGSKQLNSDYLGSEGTEVEDEQKTTVTVAHKVESKSSFWSDSKDWKGERERENERTLTYFAYYNFLTRKLKHFLN